MKRFVILSIFLSGIVLNGFSQNKPITLKPYPVAKKELQSDDYFGTKVDDPYRWLEDDKSKATTAWVKEENEVTQNYLEQIPYRKQIKTKLTETWNNMWLSVPEKTEDKFFYTYNSGIQNQNVLIMATEADPQGKVIIDPNVLSPEGYISISGFKVSKDGNYLAYSTSEKGTDLNKIYVYDLKKMKLLDEVISGVKFSEIAWRDKGFYYSKYYNQSDEKGLTQKDEMHVVYYHTVGTPQGNDYVEYINKENPLRDHTAEVTEDEKYLIITATESTSGNALLVKNLVTNNEAYFLIPSFQYEWEVIGSFHDSLLVKTNFKAPNYQLVLLNPNRVDTSNIKVVIKEDPGMVLKSASLANHDIIVSYQRIANSFVFIFTMDGKMKKTIDTPLFGTVDKVKGWKDYPMAFFSYTSFIQPYTVFMYDLVLEKHRPFLSQRVNISNDDYVVQQVSYSSFDQTMIPMFIVYKKGLLLNGSNPALMYGYGGFNVSITPTFNPLRKLFVDNGGILAVPNIRGGGELGENWYKAGVKEKKQFVFNDFIAAAQYLIDNSYTNSSKLAIQGASNGGLLIGACMTQRPELFKVALPAVGVMDMLRFHLFTIGWAWKSDYGSSEDKAGFENLYKYSPLHRIKAGTNYPATLVTTADHDDRVVPAHSFKFIATLQEKNKGSNPMLIRIQTNAGHGNGKSTTVKIDEAADVLAFTFYNLGMSFKSDAKGETKVKDKKSPGKPSYMNDPVYRKNVPGRYPGEAPKTPEQGKGQEQPKK